MRTLLPARRGWLFGWLLLFLPGRALQAQTANPAVAGGLPGEQHLIPPAPTTARLGTYGSLPVDLNAGVVSVSVPLGEIRCRSLAVPITLSYRTTGVRVEEVASWAGLGWDLNPGGLVTRTVRGLPDESPNGYFATYPRWLRADSLYHDNPTPVTRLAKQNADKDAGQGLIDTEPDTYTISLPGYSATFILDVHRRIHLSPAKNWTLRGGPEGQWKAISPEGIVYDFDELEQTEPQDDPNGLSGPAIPFYSVWHLSAITSATGKDNMWFDYVSNVGGFAQVVPVNRVSRAKLYARPYNPENNDPTYCALDQPFSDGNVVQAVNYRTVSLRRISTATTTVDFNSELNRLDLSPVADAPGRRLTSVVFADSRNPAVSRRFDFTYAPITDLFDRLRLDAVQQVGEPAYTFQYNNSVNLPVRTSNAQDHWGFYNGQVYNCSLIPAPPASVASYRIPDPSACADRTSNPATMQAGVLTSVHYPTGGQTFFTYEANGIREANNAADNTITSFTAAASGLLGDTSPSQLDPVSQAVYDQLFVPNTWPGEPSVGARVFTLPHGASNVSVQTYYHPATSTSFQTFYELWKLDEANPTPAAYQLGTKIYPPVGFPSIVPSTLAAGTYLLFAATTEQSDGATLEAKMHVETGEPFHDRTVGGLRIRRMVDYAPAGDSLVSAYDYTRYDSVAQRRVSSGRLFFDPQYVRFTACNAAILAAADARTISYAQEGYHIGYDEVSVTHHGSVNGKTTYTYLNRLGSSSRNLVLKETVTDGAGRLLKELTNSYAYNVVDLVPLNRPVFNRYTVKPPDNSTGGIPWWTVTGEIYDSSGDLYPCYQEPLLHVAREKLFAVLPAGGGPALARQAVRTYSYQLLPGGQPFSRPSWVRQSLSTGQQLATHTTYAREYAATAPADAPAAGLAELAAHRVQTAPVETQQWRYQGLDSVLVGGSLTHYRALLPQRAWHLEPAVPVASPTFTAARIQNQRLVQDARYVELASYDRYDRWGNVEEEHYLTNRVSYLWDDTGTYLLAKASQAPYAQIGYTSFEPASSGRWTYDPAAVTAHGVTGRQCYVWGQTAVALDSIPPGTYNLTLWATNPPTVRLNGAALAPPAAAVVGPPPAGGGPFRLYRYQLVVPLPLSTVAISGPAGKWLDEVRWYPRNALLQSYTADPLNGITSQTDPTGRPITYEYDALGRLLRARDEQGRILSQQQYHYAKP